MQPLVFMQRRVLFILITVYAFDSPWLQFLLLNLMNMAYLCYILSAKANLFEDEHRMRLEVAAEFLNLLATVTLMQFCRGNEYDEDM